MKKAKYLVILLFLSIVILLIPKNTKATDLLEAAQDATSTATETMNQQAKQTFNSLFTAYEGRTCKGAEIKSLINAVKSRNALDSEHQVIIYSTEISSSEDLNSTTNYSVKLYYASDVDENVVPDGNSVEETGTEIVTEAGYVYAISIEEYSENTVSSNSNESNQNIDDYANTQTNNNTSSALNNTINNTINNTETETATPASPDDNSSNIEKILFIINIVIGIVLVLLSIIILIKFK